jgi:(p)ppGpp synthase/HD superfamily hydrolase
MSGTYSPILERAIRMAIALHETQNRKTGNVPYISHLIHVAMIIRAHDFSEHVVCAALLHDTLEDTKYTAEEMIEDFGERICSIVVDLTENKHLRWEQRKAAYLETVRHASPESKAVCCADKIHNLSTILAEYRANGDDVWRVFSRGKEATMGFYRNALTAITHGWEHPLADEYRRVLEEAARTLGL